MGVIEEGLTREMLGRLRSMEIKAELVEKPGRFGSTQWIKVSRQNFDEVRLLVHGDTLDGYYHICYVIECTVSAVRPKIKARMKPIREHRFWGKVKEIKWTDGALAASLNYDIALLKSLMETGQTRVQIRSNREDRCVEILSQRYFTALYWGIDCLHSLRTVESYNRIAKHVRGIVGR